MRVAKRSGEYKLTRKHGHYSMTFYTDSTKRVNTDIQKELRVSILTSYPGNTFEFTPAELNEYGQPRTDQPLTFSVSQQKNDNHASCCTTKWKIKLYKLRAHWDQNWGSNKFAWLKLFVADDCYLNIRITYDKERQSKFKSMWYQRNKERRRQRKRVAWAYIFKIHDTQYTSIIPVRLACFHHSNVFPIPIFVSMTFVAQ